jgi:hypothetical protein
MKYYYRYCHAYPDDDDDDDDDEDERRVADVELSDNFIRHSFEPNTLSVWSPATRVRFRV